ncbi:MAG: SPOR domain-containing protein [Nitrospirae bacterium]|nr:SPOR domain-containing protein [Nitrospirota bacterium]
MSNRFFDKIGYNFIEGKGLLIVIVVLFSSVSFILGFFAGKKVSATSVLQAKKDEPAFFEAKAAKTPPPAPPLKSPEIAPVKPPEEPQTAKKPYEIINQSEPHSEPAQPSAPVAQPPKAEPLKPEQPKPDHSKAEQTKPEQPRQVAPAAHAKPEPALLPKTPAPAEPKAKTPKIANNKHLIETKAQPVPTPSPAPVKPNPPVKDVLTPVTPPSQAAEGTVQTAKTTAKHQKPPKDIPAASSGEKYFIQIGAFRGFSDAMKLQEDLKSKGFDANIVKNQVDDGVTLYKVRIGGNLSKAEASQTMTTLNKKGMRGFIKETQR